MTSHTNHGGPYQTRGPGYNWQCPSCGYANGAYDAWCLRCGPQDPGTQPGLRQQLPGTSVSHPGAAALYPTNVGSPPGPRDDWQYFNGSGDVQFRQIGPLDEGSPGPSTRQYGPITYGDSTRRYVAWRGVIQSPVFDLRPDLGDSAGTTAFNAQPIWRGMASGAGSQLALQVTETPRPGTTNVINVWATEWGTVWQANQVALLGGATAVTPAYLDGAFTRYVGQDIDGDDVTSNPRTSTLLFAPPSNPIRYWQVVVAIDVLPRIDEEQGAYSLVAPTQAQLPMMSWTMTVQ